MKPMATMAVVPLRDSPYTGLRSRRSKPTWLHDKPKAWQAQNTDFLGDRRTRTSAAGTLMGSPPCQLASKKPVPQWRSVSNIVTAPANTGIVATNKECSNQPTPCKHWRFHQCHANTGAAHIEQRYDDVDRTHHRRNTQQVHRKDRKVHTDTTLVRRAGDRMSNLSPMHLSPMPNKASVNGRVSRIAEGGSSQKPQFIQTWQSHILARQVPQRNHPVSKTRLPPGIKAAKIAIRCMHTD